MKKTLCIILAVMFLTVSLCACGGSKSVVGSWSGTTEGVAITMTFEKDGSGEMSVMGGLASEEFTYTNDADTITIIGAEGGTETFGYKLGNDTLTLTADGEELILTKVK